MVGRLEFNQMLQLQKAKVLIAKPDGSVFVGKDIAPLTDKAFEAQVRYGFLDRFAYVLPDRIEFRHPPIELRPHVAEPLGAGGAHNNQ